MKKSEVRPTDDEITQAVNTYSDMLFKMAFMLLKNKADAEDAVSETFLKYITKGVCFTSEEHKKAWLIRVLRNVCKDRLKFLTIHRCIDIEEVILPTAEESDKSIISSVMKLPRRYKEVIYLFYIEGYKCEEIAEILNLTPCNVRKRLQKGRNVLKMEYEEDMI